MAEQGPTLYGLTFNGAWSQGASKRSEWYLNPNKDVPYPGQYNPKFINKPKSSQYTVGKAQRQGLENKSLVAPVGRYNIAENIEDNDRPAFTMGGPRQNIEMKQGTVGPFSYAPKQVAQSQPQFTFGYKEQTDWAKDGPAPNEYQTIFDDDKMHKTLDSWKQRKTGFGTGSRGFIPKSIDLGQTIDTYCQSWVVQSEPRINFGSKDKFCQESKRTIEEIHCIQARNTKQGPGPGQYAPKLSHSKSQGYSIGNKYIPIRTSDVDTPGPGTYEPQNIQQIQNALFGREGKFDLVDKETQMKPGPGDYDQILPPAKVSHLDTLSIGTSLRPPIANTNQVPGPGKYLVEPKPIDGPKYSLRPKNERHKVNLNPGPGQYEPQDVLDKPPYHYTVPYTPQPGLGRSNRSTPIYSKFKNVGPGSYDVQQHAIGGARMRYKCQHNPSIGKAQRFKPREPEDVGPALYKIPDTIGKVPKYLLEKNKESQFMSLQAQEQQLRLSQKVV